MPRFGVRSLLALVCLGMPALPAAEYHLAPDGDDRGDGTHTAPWRTLTHANTHLAPGDTLILADGTHAGEIAPVRSGEPGRPITYCAARPGGAVLTGAGPGGADAFCIRLVNVAHVVIEGLGIHPTRGGQLLMRSARHCVLRQCTITGAADAYYPMITDDSHFNRFEDLVCGESRFLGPQGHVHGDLWNVTGSTHNVFLRVRFLRVGHRPLGLDETSAYNVIRACVFANGWGRNFEFFSTPRLLMEQCVVTEGFDGSGSADGRAKIFVVDSIIRHNVSFRNHAGPTSATSYHPPSGRPAPALRGSRIYHNTWTANAAYGIELADLGREPDTHLIAGNVFQNSLVAGNDAHGDGLALRLAPNIAADNRFVANNLFGRTAADRTVRYDWPKPGFDRWTGTQLTTDDANRSWPAQFVANIAVPPGFREPGADDYRLRPDSACIDAGRPLTVTRSAGSGRVLAVADARFFYDGFDIPGETGDRIVIGAERRPARIVAVDLDAGQLTLDRDLAWAESEVVTLPHAGAAPDLGAYEAGESDPGDDRGPRIPPGLRIDTMATANEPMVTTGFEPENRDSWFYLWNFSRQKNTNARLETGTARTGAHAMRVFASGDGSILACDIRPRDWDIDRFPFIRLAYRIPPGTPVGLWVHAFPSRERGDGTVCLGGTDSRAAGAYPDLGRHHLLDDDRWHEIVLDARAIREVWPDVRRLQLFRFFTAGNAPSGAQFWFDDFSIEPAR